MELTSRLRTIADQVPVNARFADIGTDHGYLPVSLLLKGRIRQAIATDLRAGPLERARETAKKFGVTAQVSFRLCNGLRGVCPDEVNVISMAGMGGETIAAILEEAPWTRQGALLLLQPMTSCYELRKWLQESGYAIEKERIACEGKRLYSIWIVKGGEMAPMTQAELWGGCQSNDPLREAYLALMIEKVSRTLSGHRAAKVSDEAAIQALEAALMGLQRMREELRS